MIKAIACDVDGTFLRNDMTYNVELYKEILDLLDKTGVKLVFATGNQYNQVQRYFDNSFHCAAENGTILFLDGKQFSVDCLDKETVTKILDITNKHTGFATLLCGTKSTYLEHVNDAVYATLKTGFMDIEIVDDLRKIEDDIVKVTLFFDEGFNYETINAMFYELKCFCSPTTSGFGYVDIMKNGCNKATGLAKFNELFNITFDDWIAFGDSNNDLQMFKAINNNYAMKNATNTLKDEATHILDLTNDEDGALKKIKELLKNEANL